jgi:hypothetical protein
MTYRETTFREHARIAILRFLEDAPRYTSNLSVLATLLPQCGLDMTRDQIAGELAWLAEQGLITTEATAGLVIATATVRGVEVAQGIARHPGVRRPAPRS